LQAKEKGLINSIADLLIELEQAGFRISANLQAKILEND
jgi:predicted nucleic acid-binding protein